ncbi:MAG: winged helix-turn-helix domain-containing protein [Alphaproteobacteria bacterium]|nr:winged helix-turn-helix domain-containing protein [Alphaproteobacteria bacterium]
MTFPATTPIASAPRTAPAVWRFDGGALDLDRRRVLVDGDPPRPLNAQETAVLRVLVDARGHTVTRDTLRARAWPGEAPTRHALDAVVSRLRRKLRVRLQAPTLLQTDRGSGYRLVGVQPGPAGRPTPAARILVDGACIDLTSRTVARGDVVHPLTALETALLTRLAACPGDVVAPDALLRDVWGYGARVRTRTLDTTVARLRRKLERDPASPVILERVRGQGLCLHVPDTTNDAPTPPVGSGEVFPHLSRGLLAQLERGLANAVRAHACGWRPQPDQVHLCAALAALASAPAIPPDADAIAR